MMLKTAAYHSRILGAILVLIALSCAAVTASAQTSNGGSEGDSLTINLPFPFGGEDQFNPIESPAGFDFAWPSNFTYEIVLNEETGMYSIQQLVGDTIQYRPTTFLTLDEYLNFDMEGNLTEYWNELQVEDDEAERAFAPKLTVDSKLFETIFGSNEIEIKPQGSAELTFGVNISNTENPRIPYFTFPRAAEIGRSPLPSFPHPAFRFSRKIRPGKTYNIYRAPPSMVLRFEAVLALEHSRDRH